ncbi:MAG: CBS domain-containing protein, partial [Cyanobacteria bacterium J06555_13]
MLPPETLIEDAITAMSEAQTSYVLITEQQRPIGIFTERDLVRLIASAEPTQGNSISAVMSKPVRSLRLADSKDTFSLAEHMQQHRLRHLPIVNEDGQLVGIVTNRSLRNALKFSTLLQLQRVEHVMNAQVICAPLSAMVRQIAQKMDTHQVSCVVIVDADNRPAGIITERDIIQFQILGLDLNQTPAQAVMSTPLFPIHPKNSLWDTHQHMNQRRVRRFVVCTPEGALAGLITQSSLLKALDPVEVRHIIERLQQEADQLRVENQAFLKARNRELEQSALDLTTKLHDEQQEHHQADDKVRFQAGLLAAVAQAVIATDLDGQILYWNPYAETLYGWQSAEVLGRSILEVTPTDMTRTQAAEIMACLQQGAQWSGEFVAQRKDGSSFPAWVLDSP